MLPLIITAAVLCVHLTQVNCVYKLQEQFNWKILDFEYPTDEERAHALRTGKFVPENALPVGIEIWRDKLFVSVPRWKPGIPATLNYIPLNEFTERSPKLIPYPSLKANEVGNCERGLTTVYRIKADACDRLWVLDTGTFGIGNTTTNPCPYAINVIDLRTNKRLHRYEFRKEDTNANTFIANTAIEIRDGNCDDAHAYFSDELGYGLIVYSLKENESWRFEHGFFLPDPLRGDFNVGGLHFQWYEEGIFGMSLSPEKSGKRMLYFSPLASHHQFAVATDVLRNRTKVDDSYQDFVVVGRRADRSHTTSRVMDENGIEYFNLIDRDAIGCWNSMYPYEPDYHNVIDHDQEALSFPADVKIDAEKNLWIISDRMPNFLLSKLDYKQTNFRIMFAPIDVMTRGTICEHIPQNDGNQQGQQQSKGQKSPEVDIKVYGNLYNNPFDTVFYTTHFF